MRTSDCSNIHGIDWANMLKQMDYCLISPVHHFRFIINDWLIGKWIYRKKNGILSVIFTFHSVTILWANFRIKIMCTSFVSFIILFFFLSFALFSSCTFYFDYVCDNLQVLVNRSLTIITFMRNFWFRPINIP